MQYYDIHLITIQDLLCASAEIIVMDRTPNQSLCLMSGLGDRQVGISGRDGVSTEPAIGVWSGAYQVRLSIRRRYYNEERRGIGRAGGKGLLILHHQNS